MPPGWEWRERIPAGFAGLPRRSVARRGERCSAATRSGRHRPRRRRSATTREWQAREPISGARDAVFVGSGSFDLLFATGEIVFGEEAFLVEAEKFGDGAHEA